MKLDYSTAIWISIMVLALPPSKADRLQALAQPIEDKPALDPKPIRIKHEFWNDEKHLNACRTTADVQCFSLQLS
jgi:hypothetical protein